MYSTTKSRNVGIKTSSSYSANPWAYASSRRRWYFARIARVPFRWPGFARARSSGRPLIQ